MASKISFVLAVCFVLFLSGCSAMSNQNAHQKTVQSWTDAVSHENWTAVDSISDTNTNTTADQAELNFIATPLPSELVALVRAAMQHNHDLRKAALRVKAALHARQIAASSLWPDAQFRYGVTDSDGNRRDTTSLSASWELDLWGKLANSRKAGFADWLSQRELYRGAQQSLQTSVAVSWLDAIEKKQLLNVSNKNLNLQKQRLVQIERRVNRGLSDALDLRLIRNQVANLENRMWQNQSAYEEALRRLAVLVGSYPSAQDVLPDALPILALPKHNIPPKALLQLRPDIVAAEHRMTAQSLRVAEAKKRMLPQLTLGASFGNAETDGNNIFDLEDWVEQFTANLLLPLFRGGELRAAADRQLAQAQIAVEEYKQVVLEAWLEVENLTAAEKQLFERRQAVEVALKEALAAEKLTQRKYEQGLANSFELLSAQNRSINAEDAWIRIKISHFANRLRLHAALGQFLLQDVVSEEVKSS